MNKQPLWSKSVNEKNKFKKIGQIKNK